MTVLVIGWHTMTIVVRVYYVTLPPLMSSPPTILVHSGAVNPCWNLLRTHLLGCSQYTLIIGHVIHFQAVYESSTRTILISTTYRGVEF